MVKAERRRSPGEGQWEKVPVKTDGRRYPEEDWREKVGRLGLQVKVSDEGF